MNLRQIKELVVLSGKGGTGKTSITASFAVLAGQAVLADCDVGAANLQLVLEPKLLEQQQIYSGNGAEIRYQRCVDCDTCRDRCRFDAIFTAANGTRQVDPFACEGCGACRQGCPSRAIEFPERQSGSWMVSDTRCGVMVHAQSTHAAGDTGRLVARVREEAWEQALQKRMSLIISDGPSGIGWPVIASLSGVSLVLVITEPSVAGLHNLQRILALARHFSVPAAVCVNKWDLNPQLTERVEAAARAAGAEVTTRIRYDRLVPQAQLHHKAVVELEGPAAEDIRTVWQQVVTLL